MQASWFTILFYGTSLLFTKISICFLYLTLFKYEWARKACYMLLAVVAVSNLFVVISILTACIPLQAYWDPTVAASFCQPLSTYWANTGITIGTDIIVFLLPIPMIMPLKLPRRQKVSVTAVFVVGFA
jgi:Kef-type K+ transport system membrane component KefB